MTTKLSAEAEMAELVAIVDALPNYLTRGHLYTSIPSTVDRSQQIPVSVGIAQDRLVALQARPELTAAQKTELAGIAGRLEATRRLYPETWEKKLAAEQRSRANVARQKAEED